MFTIGQKVIDETGHIGIVEAYEGPIIIGGKPKAPVVRLRDGNNYRWGAWEANCREYVA